MATDLNLETISSGFNISKINTNFQSIDTAFQDVVSRSGTNPNSMNADFDMNGNDILNVDNIDVHVLTFDGVPFIPGDGIVVDPDALIPVGGTDGQVLTKQSADDYDIAWEDVPEGIPAGGTDGQVLTKQSGSDFDADWEDIPSGIYFNVMDYGAVGDGVADEHVAFQDTIDAALAVGGGTVFIPRGTYWFPDTTPSLSLDPGAGDIVFLGEGDASILHYDEGTGSAVTDPTAHAMFKNIADVAKGSLRFESLQFRGTMTASPGRRGGTTTWLDYYTSVVFHHCRFYDIANVAMDIHYCDEFETTGCRFESIAADCIRARDTPNCYVAGNYIIRCGDDPIALHMTSGETPVRRGLIITGNNIVNATGRIVALGSQRVVITENTCILSGTINAGDTQEVEGALPVRDILIANNILDTTRSIDSTTGVPQSGLGTGILISGVAPRGAVVTNSTIPGRYNTTTSLFVFPWDYDEVDTRSASNPVYPAAGIVITGNILRRTQKAVAAFSDYGYGTMLGQGIAYDPAITDANLRQNVGIYLNSPGLRGAVVTGNVIESWNYGITVAAPTNDYSFDRIVISHNAISNCLISGIEPTGAAFNSGLMISENVIDADPYRQYTNSNTDGTYDANSAPFGVRLGTTKGAIVRNNTFKNCCVMVQSNTPTNHLIENNLGYCGMPVANGFNTGNKGIGDVQLAGSSYRFVIIDADPTSATYGLLTTMQYTEASAMPASGSWLRGAFVKNTQPSLTGGMVVNGWLRLTNGTGNVAGTDWAVIQNPHGNRLQGTATYDPASLADGAGATTTVTVTGAALGDIAEASFSNALQGITLTAWVSAADTVSVRFQNESGGVLDLASGTLKAWVWK
jgi:putative cofactor-binding repeat protein